MKTKLISFLAAIGIASTAGAAVTLSGTSLLNATGLVGGQNALYVVGTPGPSLDASTDLLTDLSTALGTNTTAEVFGSVSLGAGVSFDQTPIANQQFSVIVFGSSALNQAAPGDTYSYWTDASWLIPVGDGTFNFGGAGPFAQLSGPAAGSGSVVPEPSTYAMLAGALALVAVMIRRRK